MDVTLSQTLRQTLYQKNDGKVAKCRSGFMEVESPISGANLTVTHPTGRFIKDPVTGTALEMQNGRAVVTTRDMNQDFLRSRKFRVQDDIDITIQQLRRTTYVNSRTNEKIGTSGSPTGMDPCLTTQLL
ncbi:hypothetical protein BSKO_01415 [Bryopsis sp. KO-2023]|nr:hypothetical protein BSKO_01415 [Bryopsis sp. KO-2023]